TRFFEYVDKPRQQRVQIQRRMLDRELADRIRKIALSKNIERARRGSRLWPSAERSFCDAREECPRDARETRRVELYHFTEIEEMAERQIVASDYVLKELHRFRRSPLPNP